MNIDHVENSTVGNVSAGALESLIGLFGPIAKDLLNAFLADGIDLAWILKDLLHIDFIEFDKTYLEPFEDYFIFKVTPRFNLDNDSVQRSVDRTFSFLSGSEEVQEIINQGASLTMEHLSNQI